ncbi:MAG: SPOR domain-containing protein [Gemmatimonadota bacterium]
MTDQHSAGFDWEAAGRALSGSLDRLNSIVVVGSDENDTARAALGIARQQAKRRPVALGDLLGDAEPIQSLAPSDDPHGLADVFEYGVSMDRVARKVAGVKNLFVLPTGVFVTNQSEILSNRRWSRLAAGFREEQGLLILVASVDAPDIEALVVQLDGAVVVGHRAPPRLPVSRVLGTVTGPALPPRETRTRPRPSMGYVIFTGHSPWRTTALAGITISLLAALFVGWLVYRPFARSAWAPMWLRGDDTLRGLVLPMATPDDSASAAAVHMGLLTKADSESQAPFALSLVTFNTQAGALLELQRNGANLRAGTFTPVLIRETPWFRVVAGAYADSASAAALLDSLRSKGMSDAGPVVIERRPYALQVERAVPDTGVANRVAMYKARQLPVYALLQSNGTARLFAGAFKNKDETGPLAELLRAAGIQTVVVFRTGRVY